jgi:hypothetical protein
VGGFATPPLPSKALARYVSTQDPCTVQSKQLQSGMIQCHLQCIANPPTPSSLLLARPLWPGPSKPPSTPLPLPSTTGLPSPRLVLPLSFFPFSAPVLPYSRTPYLVQYFSSVLDSRPDSTPTVVFGSGSGSCISHPTPAGPQLAQVPGPVPSYLASSFLSLFQPASAYPRCYSTTRTPSTPAPFKQTSNVVLSCRDSSTSFTRQIYLSAIRPASLLGHQPAPSHYASVSTIAIPAPANRRATSDERRDIVSSSWG